MAEQLFIENYYIPLTKSLNASITKSITDVEQPDKRKATYSKSVRVPNSKEANEVFDSIFMVNAEVGTFDPTVKADVRYIVDGETIINGYCQLTNIYVLDNKDIDYEIVMYGSIANIFSDMGEKYLDDSTMVAILDEWDHPFSKEVQEFSWATQVYNSDSAGYVPFAYGTGYVYPLINYGLSTTDNDYEFTQLPCSLYVKEYIDAIFTSNGFTYTSTFFDSTYFKHLIIPSSPANYQLTSTEIADREFTANTPLFTSTGTTTSNNLTTSASFSTPEILRFSVETSDPGLNYDPATGVFTAVNAGLYNFYALVDVNATFTPTTGSSVVTVSDIEGRLELFLEGSLIQSTPFYITYDDFPSTYTTGARSTNTAPTYPNEQYLQPSSTFFHEVTDGASAISIPRAYTPPDRYLVQVNNVLMAAGDTMDLRWKARYRGLNGNANRMFKDVSGTYYPGTAVLNISVGAFYNTIQNTYPAEGNTLSIEKIIPKKIKQKDFLMSIVKLFNLWIDIDPDNETNLLIEPRDSFLGSTVVNCQTLLDQSREHTITPMGKSDAGEYYFSYKSDKDYLNQKYEGDYQEVYGSRTVLNNSEFLKSKKDINVIFSPTPLSAPPNSDRVVSTIIQLDANGQETSVDSNIRILYYGGLKDTFVAWNHINFLTGWPYLANPTVETQYPYAGHLDDPFNATEDINFGLVNEMYYDDPLNAISWTDNNLVNKYYSNMLGTYTDPNSKIFRGWFNLSPVDFRDWTFDKLYWFENAYWRLNKIENYNPTGDELTMCEFLFLEYVESFQASSVPIVGDKPITTPNLGGGSGDFTETTPTKKASLKSNDSNSYGKGTVVLGENNGVALDSYYVKIQGDGNKVYSMAENIYIQGNDNTVDAGLYNVTLINTNNIDVTESNVTYINGKKVESWTTQTADFSVSDEETGYFVDATAGDIIITISAKNNNADWIFKRVDGTGNTVTFSTGVGIDIALQEATLDAYESIRLKYNKDTVLYNITN